MNVLAFQFKSFRFAQKEKSTVKLIRQTLLRKGFSGVENPLSDVSIPSVLNFFFKK